MTTRSTLTYLRCPRAPTWFGRAFLDDALAKPSSPVCLTGYWPARQVCLYRKNGPGREVRSVGSSAGGCTDCATVSCLTFKPRLVNPRQFGRDLPTNFALLYWPGLYAFREFSHS